MRYVPRTGKGKPPILGSKHAHDAIRELRSYYELPLEERQARRPPLKRSLWNSPSVREVLYALFQGKCAFCEKFEGNSGDEFPVEHFRPLWNAVGERRAESGQPSIEHYAWLAYEWNNLLLVCRDCNAIKRNSFPVTNSRANPMTNWRKCDATEKPMLINPCVDRPSTHLAFLINGECVGVTPRGVMTVRCLGLNRERLIQERKLKLERIHELLCRCTRSSVQPVFSDLLVKIRKLMSGDAEFSGAIQAFLQRPLALMRRRNPPIRDYLPITAEALVSLMANAPRVVLEEFIDRLSTTTPPIAVPPDSRRIRSEEFAPSGSRPAPAGSSIKHVSIRNFKAIESLDMELITKGRATGAETPATAILGENSMGKSSILQAIALALMPEGHIRSLPQDIRSSFVGKAVSPDQGSARRLSATVTVSFESGENRVFILRDDGEFVQRGGGDVLTLAYGASRMFGDEACEPLTFPARQRTHSLFIRNKEVKHSAAWLRGLRGAGFQAVSRAMREVLALEHEDRLEKGPDRNLFVHRRGVMIAVKDLSDGYRSLFAMALDIMRNMASLFGNLEDARGVVLIDEIELHLHPRWKMQVVGALRRAMPNVQFIFTTHDPLCLRGMYDGEVKVLARDSGGKVRTMEGLPDVRLMRAEQLLTSEYFGLSSTSDPEILDELNARAASSAPNSGRKRSHLVGDQIALEIPIGDSIVDQIINEAFRIYLLQKLSAPGLNRSSVRQDAVQEVLAALRAGRSRSSE